MNFAGTWTEKKKDGSKGGNRLNVIKMGPFLVGATPAMPPAHSLSQHSRVAPPMR